jgi:hypothetical protein
MTPLVPPQRIQLCKLGSKLHRTSSVNDTAGAASAVSMTPLVTPQRIQLCKLSSKLHRTSGVIDTASAASAVSLSLLVRYDTAGAGDLEFERLWLSLKGISIEKIYIGKLYYPIAKTITQKIGVI